MLKLAPRTTRGSFLAGLVRNLTPSDTDSLIARLKADRAFDDALLLPIEAARLASMECGMWDTASADSGCQIPDSGSRIPDANSRTTHSESHIRNPESGIRNLASGIRNPGFERCLNRAFDVPDATASVLEAIAVETADRADLRERWAGRLANALDRIDAPGWAAAWSWALARGDARAWLGPFLVRVFPHPDQRDHWRLLPERTPAALRPALADVALSAAARDDVPSDALVWAVDELYLALEPRPEADRDWANAYLDRVAGLDLTRWLYLKESRRPALVAWLEAERRRGTIAPRHQERFRVGKLYAEIVRVRIPQRVTAEALPDVPPERRGELLDHLLQVLGGAAEEALGPVLEAARQVWPGGFLPGAPGLAGIGRTLAAALMSERGHPSRWFERLDAILDRLDLAATPSSGFEPQGLAAHVVAATALLATHESSVWPLRKFLFRHEHAWRTLTLDLRAELAEDDRAACQHSLSRWDQALTRGTGPLEIRFHELLFNACPGPKSLAQLVQARAAEVRSLGKLSWWGRAGSAAPAACDLRDAFARLVPMTPLDPEPLPLLRDWMRRSDAVAMPEFDLDGLGLDPDECKHAPPMRLPHLSREAELRWRCLDALSGFARSQVGTIDRIQSIKTWISEDLPLGRLSVTDQKRFLATVFWKLDGLDGSEIQHDRILHELAAWLVRKVGFRDRKWFPSWYHDLDGAVPEEIVRGRKYCVQTLQREIADFA